MTCWDHPQFWGISLSISYSVLTVLVTWSNTHKICGKFDQSIAVPTNMLKRFQNSCGRQHRQQPLPHNSRYLFSQRKCVLSFENEGKMWMLSESVDMSTWKYGVPQLPADYTHILPVPCPPSEQFMPLLQGHCKPVISRRWKLREKGGLKDYIRSEETQPITNREYISWGKPVSNIGLMPLQLENAHATALELP